MDTSNDELNRVLHAIADPTRRRILQLLHEGGSRLCAREIEACIRLSQPTISHHMAILIKSGLVEAKKLGHSKWYSRNEAAVREFCRKLRESL